MDNPIVLTYITEVSISCPKHLAEKARKQLNIAWGFKDGNCNVCVDNKFVSKPGADDEEFKLAHWRLNACERISLRVSVHKNGNTTVEIVK